jgi:hypothetical protein
MMEKFCSDKSFKVLMEVFMVFHSYKITIGLYRIFENINYSFNFNAPYFSEFFFFYFFPTDRPNFLFLKSVIQLKKKVSPKTGESFIYLYFLPEIGRPIKTGESFIYLYFLPEIGRPIKTGESFIIFVPSTRDRQTH